VDPDRHVGGPRDRLSVQATTRSAYTGGDHSGVVGSRAPDRIPRPPRRGRQSGSPGDAPWPGRSGGDGDERAKATARVETDLDHAGKIARRIGHPRSDGPCVLLHERSRALPVPERQRGRLRLPQHGEAIRPGSLEEVPQVVVVRQKRVEAVGGRVVDTDPVNDLSRLLHQDFRRMTERDHSGETEPMRPRHDPGDSEQKDDEQRDGPRGREPPAAPASARSWGEGVSPAARAAARGSPPGKAAATASADAGRPAGSVARHRMTTRSTAGSSSFTRRLMLVGVPLTRCSRSLAGVAPRTPEPR